MGFRFLNLLIGIAFLLTACGKQEGSSFVFTGETPPQAPVITNPASQTLTVHSAFVRIEGCFNPECKAVSKMVVQATGAGTLIQTDSSFRFETTLTSGETRTFSFTVVNGRGDVSPPTSVTLTYQNLVELLPQATLYNGGASGSKKTQGGLVLNFLTSFPSMPESEITAGGLVLTSGGLNPQ